MFFEYGDDSVAQLGGVHLACEQASNLLTKVLEWGRLMAYLEQSTRYIAYDARLGGRYRYYRDPEVLELAARHPLRRRPGPPVRHLRRAAAGAARTGSASATRRSPATPTSSTTRRSRPRRSTRCAASCPRRRCRTSASTAPARRYEALLLRMRAHPLPEARDVRRADARRAAQGHPVVPRRGSTVADRGGAWSDVPRGRPATPRTSVAAQLFADDGARADGPTVTLVDFDPDGEDKLLAAICYPHTAPARGPAARARVAACSRRRARRAACGPTSASARNRRHKPGRAFERIDYRFDVLADYGAFRDLQRHRMLTIEWQPLTPRHGYDAARGGRRRRRTASAFDEAMERSADAATTRSPSAFPAAGRRTRCRSPTGSASSMQMNAREAMHLLELRTAPAGPPRLPAWSRQEMHRLIAEQAGHRAIAEMMRFVDHRRATSSSGSTPSAGPKPAASAADRGA